MLAVVHVLGQLLTIFGLTFVLPIITSLLFRDGTWWAFVVAALFCAGLGLCIWAATRRFKRELKSRDGFLLVTLAWVLGEGVLAVRSL